MQTYTSVVVTDDSPPPASFAHTAERTSIGRVQINGTVIVQACDPAHLRLIAEACTDAARLLSDELDREAARQMRAEADALAAVNA